MHQTERSAHDLTGDKHVFNTLKQSINSEYHNVPKEIEIDGIITVRNAVSRIHDPPQFRDITRNCWIQSFGLMQRLTNDLNQFSHSELQNIVVQELVSTVALPDTL
jgi:hypothetical protein